MSAQQALESTGRSAPAGPRKGSRRKPGTRASLQRTYMLMLMPALLLVIGIMVPFINGVWTSLTDKKSYINDPSFVGLENYFELFADEAFLRALGRTILYVGVVLAVQLPLAIMVAILLARTSVGSWLTRRVLVLPLLIPPIVAGLMWKTMLQPSAGVINYMLGLVGIPPQPWLTDIATSLGSVILIDTWAFLPFSTLIILAGLQSLPEEIKEASQVDGAGPWNVFRYISLPWIAPYVVLVAIFRVADSFKQFDLVWPVTRGGPIDSTRLLHVMGYEEVFRFSSPARGMAVIFVLWILVYVVSTYLLKVWRRTINAVG